MKHLQFIIFVLALFSACQNKNKAITTTHVAENDITTININHPIDSIRGILSLLGENFKIVPLETKDSCLLGRATYLIGKKYIVAFSSENIILFDQAGKYVRTLAIAGRGSGEFNDITAKTLNKAEDKVFAIDYYNKFIHCWDIPSGQHTSLPLSEEGDAYTLNMLNDTIIQICNLRNKKARYKIYSQTLSGKFLNGIPNTGTQESFIINLTNNLYNTGRTQYYRPHSTDSIFQISADTLMLKYIFQLTKDQHLKIKQFTDKQMFCSIFSTTKTDIKNIQVNGNQITSASHNGFTTYYLINLPKQEITCFQNLYNDYLGVDIDPNLFSIQENGLFYVEHPASKLLSLIPGILEKTDIDTDVRQRLEKLRSEISEEDNPVLVIGNTKAESI